MKENTICTAAYDTMEDHFKKSLPQMKDSNSFLFYNDDCSVGLVMAWRSIIGYENKSPKKKIIHIHAVAPYVWFHILWKL